jgi:hypothetical protein
MAHAPAGSVSDAAGFPRDSVLVLDADGRAGLACVQSLGAAGVEVHAGVRARGSATERSRHCHHLHREPPAEPLEGGVRWLLELDRRHEFALVVPTTEASLRWLRQLPQHHPLRTRALLASDAAIDTALDKERTRALARAASASRCLVRD